MYVEILYSNYYRELLIRNIVNKSLIDYRPPLNTEIAPTEEPMFFTTSYEVFQCPTVFLFSSCESDDVVYEVLQEDMKHTHKMFQKLIPLAHPHYVTLVLCEVSLVYLPFVVSDRILKVFADVYQKSICLLYEQVNTKDPFGRFSI